MPMTPLLRVVKYKIWHYSMHRPGRLTEHVAENNTRPPQLGIHYWVGFENAHYIDEFEGIVPRVTAARSNGKGVICIIGMQRRVNSALRG